MPRYRKNNHELGSSRRTMETTKGKSRASLGQNKERRTVGNLRQERRACGKVSGNKRIAEDEVKHHVNEYKIILQQLKQANSKLLRLHKTLKKRNRRRDSKINYLIDEMRA